MDEKKDLREIQEIIQIINRLRRLKLPLNPPAKPVKLQQLAKAFDAPLPESLKILLADHNGMEPCHPMEYRLMPINEAIETNASWQEVPVFQQLDWHPLWTDDNSDWIGISFRGPLMGILSVFEHDGVFYPAFRSIQDLYCDLLDCYVAEKESESRHIEVINIDLATLDSDGIRDLYYRMSGKKPREEGVEEKWHCKSLEACGEDSFYTKPKGFGHGPFLPTQERLEEDRARVKEFWRLFEQADSRERSFYCIFIVAFTPRVDSAELLPLLDDDNFFVAQEAAESLGARRFTPAYQKLKHLAIHGISNAKSSALEALKNFPSEETLEFTLQACHHRSFKNWSPHVFMDLLVLNGCEVRYTYSSKGWKNIRYRLPNEEKWNTLRIGK